MRILDFVKARKGERGKKGGEGGEGGGAVWERSAVLDILSVN